MPNERTRSAVSDAPSRDWLLAVLRYAVTREEADLSAVLAIAEALDSRGSNSQPSSFHFFSRTSLEVCQAIQEEACLGRTAIIKRHLDRIEDSRLRRAFAAAVESALAQRPANSPKSHSPKLWRGLGS